MRALPACGKRALPQALTPAVACRMVAMTGAVRRGIIRSMEIAEADKQALIAEIEAQYKVAKAAAESGDDSQFWPLKPPTNGAR